MSCLRTYYGKEYGKEKASLVSGSSTNTVYSSKWPFFASLHFLRDNITPRKTVSTTVLEVIDENCSNPIDTSQEASISTTEFGNTNEMKSLFNTSNPPTSTKTKRKLHMSLEDDLLATCLQELKKPKVENCDADTSFGQYVINQLQKIPDGYAKEMLKLEIQQSILKVMLPSPVSVRRQPFSTIEMNDLQ